MRHFVLTVNQMLTTRTIIVDYRRCFFLINQQVKQKQNPETIAVSGFFTGADCETRTRDLLITNSGRGVFYRFINAPLMPENRAFDRFIVAYRFACFYMFFCKINTK